MKANELRIGNYIKQGKIWYLEVSEDGSYMYKAGSYGSNAEPIPLTEEWLLKLKQPNGLMVKLWKDEEGRYIFGEKWKYSIQYVHQLQNLYFALTNTELVYEP